jgi:PPOX class probable F420-dependent enzyme
VYVLTPHGDPADQYDRRMAVSVEDVRPFVRAESGLAVLATTRGDGAVQASVVNAGVMPHPVTGADVVALVAIGGSRKLQHLRDRPLATITFRAGWHWVTVEGTADLAGPDDALPGVEAADVPRLLRDVFTAAGGTHDDWDTYDRVMAEERRTAVLITPLRAYGRPLPDEA